ncbi:hypothetical protein DOI34_25800 [Salmonella enterica subsp. enterica serovar Virchow]|nr:hypothetical protein [Salmonella enterica subsp. enterica serovar Virchow]
MSEVKDALQKAFESGKPFSFDGATGRIIQPGEPLPQDAWHIGPPPEPEPVDLKSLLASILTFPAAPDQNKALKHWWETE